MRTLLELQCPAAFHGDLTGDNLLTAEVRIPTPDLAPTIIVFGEHSCDVTEIAFDPLSATQTIVCNLLYLVGPDELTQEHVDGMQEAFRTVTEGEEWKQLVRNANNALN